MADGFESYGGFMGSGIRTMSDWFGSVIGGGFAPKSSQPTFKTGVPLRGMPFITTPQSRKTSDPLTTAMNQTFNSSSYSSYFPSVNQRLYASDRSELSDMLGQSPETGFLQNKPAPTPTPTTTPVKPTQMNLSQLMQHFGIASSGMQDRTETPIWMNKPDYQVYDWLSRARQNV